MDERTRTYYTQFAGAIAQRYESIESPIANLLRCVFDDGARILDVGAGSGRDTALLLRLGYNAYGVEPCEALRQAAEARHSDLDGRLGNNALPQLGQPFGGVFDGVVCSAVLMHLQKAEILDAAISLRNVLKENGKLLLSVPLARPGLDSQHRDPQGRLFTPLAPDYLQLLFERIGFQLLEKWESTDAMAREGHAWCTFLFKARYGSGSRPLDLIEGILNRDKKTATYKLALFRALAEIATTEFEQAQWVGDGKVGIPIQLVCEKWLYYYWPLFESAIFIPQIRGEAPGSGPRIAFRPLMGELIDQYRLNGGLTQFLGDQRSGELSPATSATLGRLYKLIGSTIIDGPVTHAGNSSKSGQLFAYDIGSSSIQFGTGIWRELLMVGHWIQDATVLRWAQLTGEISKQAIRPSAAIELLLTVPISERSVEEARVTYQRQVALSCTWTGVSVPKDKFDVDHIIPFSLWHNNDLWNLVPASPRANNQKSDKLPTRELMHRCRDNIIGHWEVLRTAHTARFDHEAARMAGQKQLADNWQASVFQAVTNAIEYTAVQRGSERWQPK